MLRWLLQSFVDIHSSRRLPADPISCTGPAQRESVDNSAGSAGATRVLFRKGVAAFDVHYVTGLLDNQLGLLADALQI